MYVPFTRFSKKAFPSETIFIIAGLPILSSKRLHVQDLGAWYGRFAPFIPGDRVLLQNPRLGAYTLKVAKVSDSRFLVLLVKRGSDADIRLRKA